jgi:hypothetical protein
LELYTVILWFGGLKMSPIPVTTQGYSSVLRAEGIFTNSQDLSRAAAASMDGMRSQAPTTMPRCKNVKFLHEGEVTKLLPYVPSRTGTLKANKCKKVTVYACDMV